MNTIWTLSNKNACYLKYPKATLGGGSIWDFAASACLFNEAKKSATNIYGEPLDLNRADSTFMNHEGVLFTSNQKISISIIKNREISLMFL